MQIFVLSSGFKMHGNGLTAIFPEIYDSLRTVKIYYVCVNDWYYSYDHYSLLKQLCRDIWIKYRANWLKSILTRNSLRQKVISPSILTSYDKNSCVARFISVYSILLNSIVCHINENIFLNFVKCKKVGKRKNIL